MAKAVTIQGASEVRTAVSTEAIIQFACKSRGVTAEEVLEAIFDTLVAEVLQLLPPDATPIGMEGDEDPQAMQVITGAHFRRLMERIGALNAVLAKQVEDPSLNHEDLAIAARAAQQGAGQAAACDVFDGVIASSAERLIQEKEEAARLGQPDPYPHFEYTVGPAAENKSAAAPTSLGSGTDAAKPAGKKMWN